MAVWVCADPEPESLKMLEEVGKRLLDGFQLEVRGSVAIIRYRDSGEEVREQWPLKEGQVCIVLPPDWKPGDKR